MQASRLAMPSIADPEKRFQEIFGRKAQLYRAPGRVNLIGEHTDYNDGFVMPAAIGLYCWAAIAPRAGHHLQVHSTNFGATVSVDLWDQKLERRGDWSDYVVGTAWSLLNSGYEVTGADILIHGEIPLGSGLSSSAAIEVATAYALLDTAGQEIDLVTLAKACRRAENEFVGARVGIMDQFISANGRADHALMLDCRSLEVRSLPIPPDLRLVVCNTGVKHQLAGGEYNVRRAQCEEGVWRLAKALPSIKALRDVSPDELEEHRSLLPEMIYRRCRHVISENARVEAAAVSLRSGDLGRFGDLMAQSHRSLRDDYEVSCPELDLMVELAAGRPGVFGARMTGGGFGGCTVNLVEAPSAEVFQRAVSAEYERRTGLHPEIYALRAAEGVRAVSLNSEMIS